MIYKNDPGLKEIGKEESEAILSEIEGAVNQLFAQLYESNLKLPLVVEVTTGDGAFMKYKIDEDGNVEMLFEAMGNLVTPPFQVKVVDTLGNKANCSINYKRNAEA